MATFDDLPTLPESGNLSLDDLIGVVDLSDRRSPKKVSLSQLSDLINVTADPTPLATDIAKRLYSPTIGEVVSIYGEGGRVERFVGNLADPGKLFIAGFTPVDVELVAEDPLVEVALDGFYQATSDGLEFVQAGGLATVTCVGETPDLWQVRYDGFTVFTSGQAASSPLDVTSWTANEDYPELAEVAAPTLTAWDNSGLIYNEKPYAPVAGSEVTGRFDYAAADGSTLTYGAGEWDDGGDNTFAGTGVYPWEDEVGTRAPAANNDNWSVEHNTIYVIVENGTGDDIEIGGQTVADGVSANLGWFSPQAIPCNSLNAPIASISNGYLSSNEQTVSSIGLSINAPSYLTCPVVCEDRSTVYFYFAS